MEIHESKFVISNTELDKCPQGSKPEYAFIGRSNVGKSSLINMLCDRKKLAMTSSKPGKTKLINHFIIDEVWHLVDLPGYGYARTGKKSRESFGRLITDYILNREQLTALFVLIDLRHKPQAIDLEFMEWLGEESIPFSIVFTKADKLSRTVAATNTTEYCDALAEIWEEMPPLFVTSAEKRQGKQELLDYIGSINDEIKLESKR